MHIYKISRSLYRNIPMSVCNSFFLRQQRPLYSFFSNQYNKLQKKFNRLFSEQMNEFRDIKPIRYFYRSPPHSPNTFAKSQEFLLEPQNKVANSHSH